MVGGEGVDVFVRESAGSERNGRVDKRRAGCAGAGGGVRGAGVGEELVC